MTLLLLHHLLLLLLLLRGGLTWPHLCCPLCCCGRPPAHPASTASLEAAAGAAATRRDKAPRTTTKTPHPPRAAIQICERATQEVKHHDTRSQKSKSCQVNYNTLITDWTYAFARLQSFGPLFYGLSSCEATGIRAKTPSPMVSAASSVCVCVCAEKRTSLLGPPCKIASHPMEEATVHASRTKHPRRRRKTRNKTKPQLTHPPNFSQPDLVSIHTKP